MPFGIELDVGYMHYRTLEDCAARSQGPTGARRVYSLQRLERFGAEVVVGNMMEHLAVELKEPAEQSGAQLHGASDDRVEDRLCVGLRLADDAQDLARGGLLFEGLRQAFLERARSGAFGLLRLADHRPRRSGFRLRGLCAPAHRLFLWFHRRYDREAADDSLGEETFRGKRRDVPASCGEWTLGAGV